MSAGKIKIEDGEIVLTLSGLPPAHLSSEEAREIAEWLSVTAAMLDAHKEEGSRG